MRIIAVRGRNLASLAEAFDVDFSAAPLKDAGLFAITGPTGAGKSTLLDAICLALYDSFPRIADRRTREKTGEGGAEGAQLASTDPRTILRRGAADCSAEVEFIGVDGRLYAATWSVQRARGRADGALQKKKVALRDVEKDQFLGGTQRETLKEIERMVGLTFDQFRRTILLAQNDFDAFLSAGEKERADLLEKITGTEIYTRISQLAFERDREFGDQVKAEEARKGLNPPIDAQDRLKLELALSEAGVEFAQTQIAVEKLRNAVAWRERFAVLEAAGEKARAAVTEAEAAWARTEETRRLLESVERAEQARSAVESADRAAGRLAEAERDCVAAGEVLAKAESALSETGRDREAVDEALAALDAEAVALEPEWARAAELDHAAAEARNQAETSRAAAQSCQGEVAECAAAALERSAAVERIEEERARVRSWLEANQRDEALAHRIDDVLAGLDALAKARADRDSHAGEATKLTAAIAQIDAEIAHADQENADLAADIARFKQKENEARNALASLGGTGLKARCDALAAALTAFERARSSASSLRDAEMNEARQAKRKSDAEAAASRVKALLERLHRERAAADAALEEAKHARERAERAAGDAAGIMRESLAAGQPCPVCGGLDHPWRDRPGPWDALLAEARARHLEREQATKILRDAIEEAQAKFGASEIVIADAESQQNRFAAQRRTTQSAFAERFSVWETAARAVGLSSGAPDATSLLDATMNSAAADLERELQDGRTILAQAAILDNEAEDARKAHDSKALELREVEQRKGDASRRRADHDSARARHETRRAAIEEEAGRIVERLGFVMSARGLSAEDLEERAAKIRAELTEAAETWTAHLHERDRLDAAAHAAHTATQLARTHREAAEQRLRQAKDEAEARSVRFAALRAERDALLGGVATQAHRRAFTERRETARVAQERAVTRHADARAAHAAAENGRQAAEKAVSAGRRVQEQAESERDARLSAVGLTLDAAHALLAKGPDWIATTRSELGGRERVLRDAVLRRDDLAAETERHLAAQPAESAQDPSAELAALQERHAAFGERIGALREQIAQDDQRRAAAEAADIRIRELRARHDVWRAVSEAIGSARGDKFRSFVQAITLDQLLTLANEQFATLNPRYRLERAPAGDLSLQICDLEMGDEVRSVRSLSGGERFLASLALALGLSDLSGRRAFARTLFIDEGFGSLDAASLDMAVSALEALQSRGRQVGVISHVEAMTDRIPVQVRVMKVGAGRSRIAVV